MFDGFNLFFQCGNLIQYSLLKKVVANFDIILEYMIMFQIPNVKMNFPL